MEKGTPGNVDIDAEQSRRAEKAAAEGGFRVAYFHTHSVGTLKEYDECYGSSFSSGDKETLSRLVRENPLYVHILVTPYRILPWPQNTRVSRVTDDSPPVTESAARALDWLNSRLRQ
jgi:hypothetical protein